MKRGNGSTKTTRTTRTTTDTTKTRTTTTIPTLNPTERAILKGFATGRMTNPIPGVHPVKSQGTGKRKVTPIATPFEDALDNLMILDLIDDGKSGLVLTQKGRKVFEQMFPGAA